MRTRAAAAQSAHGHLSVAAAPGAFLAPARKRRTDSPSPLPSWPRRRPGCVRSSSAASRDSRSALRSKSRACAFERRWAWQPASTRAPGPCRSWRRWVLAMSRSGRSRPSLRPGNPKPRLFRIPQDRGIVVNYGLPNDGADPCGANAWRDCGPVPRWASTSSAPIAGRRRRRTGRSGDRRLPAVGAPPATRGRLPLPEPELSQHARRARFLPRARRVC